MARMKLKSGVLDQFKGTSHVEFEFGDTTNHILGFNGSGKSTIYDAYTYVFGGCDSQLNGKPVLYPDFMEESVPSATWVVDLNGVEHSIRKFQHDTRTRKQVEEGYPKKANNDFEIDGVPKNEKAFLKWMEEQGLPEPKTFMQFVNADIYLNKSEEERKNILFGMASNITDEDIAKSVSGGEIILGDIAKGLSLTDIKKAAKKEFDGAEKLRKAIPDEIKGMEESKVRIDRAEFEAQKETLKNEVAALEAKLMEMRIPSVRDLNQELASLNNEQKVLTAEANSERVAKLTEANAVIGDMKQKLREMVGEKERLLSLIEENMDKKAEGEKRYNELADEFQKVKVTEFNATAQKCPYCGQDLPVHEIDKLAKQFEQDKATKMDKINHEAADVKKKTKMLEAQIPELQKQLAEKNEEINVLSADIEKWSEERIKLETPIDASGTHESQEILKRIADVQHRMNTRDQLQAQADKILANKREKEQDIWQIDMELAKEDVNKQIDLTIEEAKKRQKEYLQIAADKQRIVDVANEVMRKKADLLTSEVNKHFKIVKFELFRQKADGDYETCCTPTIRNEDGVYRELGKSANTALGIRGKLDIIEGLQNYYDMHLPVFCDGFEAIDSYNAKLIHMDTQLITLAVTDTPLTLRSDDVG